MGIRHHPHTPAALLLAGIAALYASLGGGGGLPHSASRLAPAQRPLPAPGTSERKSLDWCRDNVAIIHDVYWASACTVVADEQRRRQAACSEAEASPSGVPADLACLAALEPPDDSPECTLPNDRALLLNTARAQAEQQCVDEAMASGERARVPGTP